MLLATCMLPTSARAPITPSLTALPTIAAPLPSVHGIRREGGAKVSEAFLICNCWFLIENVVKLACNAKRPLLRGPALLPAPCNKKHEDPHPGASLRVGAANQRGVPRSQDEGRSHAVAA